MEQCSNDNIDIVTQEGFKAFVTGICPGGCPYKIYTENGVRWLRGWSIAKLGSQQVVFN